MGRETADRDLEDIQTALSLLQESPDLLRHKAAISTQFKFYRVREHFLVCTKLKDSLFVLTIKHGEMDLPTRLGELEPTLVQEADLLHKRLVTAEKNVTSPTSKSNHSSQPKTQPRSNCPF